MRLWFHVRQGSGITTIMMHVRLRGWLLQMPPRKQHSEAVFCCLSHCPACLRQGPPMMSKGHNGATRQVKQVECLHILSSTNLSTGLGLLCVEALGALSAPSSSSSQLDSMSATWHLASREPADRRAILQPARMPRLNAGFQESSVRGKVCCEHDT